MKYPPITQALMHQIEVNFSVTHLLMKIIEASPELSADPSLRVAVEEIATNNSGLIDELKAIMTKDIERLVDGG